jgi:Cu/Zn superoxide dismutase
MFRFSFAALLLGCLVTPAFAAMHTTLTIPLSAQNGSGENGTATLTPEGDKTKIVIKMKNAPAGSMQPAHIHDGTCTNLDKAPKWPLEALKDGKSTTLVPATLTEIMHQKTAINIHKSATDLKDYMACGDITQAK